ncbi:MAG TPA: hypothetical protein PKA84_18340 [Rubrivivax sp.]|nr:hypothetical protein [Rhodoferax sp.]MCP5289810.1 hypothetical protein [Burkholderiaceae bacterium]HMQ74409.1 hypothetical protein [Rubrivivax sp.]HMR72182.1 hypothetical protein [Rubrivivax sp.]
MIRYIASSPQAFRGLRLLANMNAALRRIDSALDAGVDFSVEYEAEERGQQGWGAHDGRELHWVCRGPVQRVARDLSR